MRGVVYARLSKSERRKDDGRAARVQVSSLDDQIESCLALAEREGYKVVEDPFVDDGISAWSGKFRPGYIDLIERVRKGDIDVILAVEDSRLTRDVEANVFLQATCIQYGTFWHTVVGGRTNPDSADGKLMATIKAAIDEYESAVKAHRVRRSVERRLAAAKDIGGPRPFGWTKERDQQVPEEAEVLRRAYAEILDGKTVYAVTREVFATSGLHPPRARNREWRTQTVRQMLLAPRHSGRLVVKGVDYGMFADGIVSEEDWAKVKAILTAPGRSQKRGAKDKYFTGIARCGTCGSRLGSSSNYDTRCRKEGEREAKGPHANIKREVLEEAILRAMENAFIVGRVEDFAPRSGTENEITSILVQRSRLADRKREVMDRRDEGLIDGDEEKRRLKALKVRSDELDAKREALYARSAAAQVFITASAQVFRGKKTSLDDGVKVGIAVRAAFLELPVERQRELLESLIEVKVLAGVRGPGRVQVIHKVATQLNNEEEWPVPSEEELDALERYEDARADGRAPNGPI